MGYIMEPVVENSVQSYIRSNNQTTNDEPTITLDETGVNDAKPEAKKLYKHVLNNSFNQDQSTETPKKTSVTSIASSIDNPYIKMMTDSSKKRSSDSFSSSKSRESFEMMVTNLPDLVQT